MASRVPQAQDAAVVFDPAFLPAEEAATLDMSRFARGNPVLPGRYDVDIWMNGEWQARRPVRFQARDDRADATPCIERGDLIVYGLDPSAPSAVNEDPCAPLERRIDSATTRFDVSEQRLDIEVPQAAMARRRSGAVPPAQWDRGVTAGLLAWRASARRATSARRSANSFHAGADAGINAGAWRLRHAGSWAGRRYTARHTYLDRPLAAWRSQLRVGAFPLADDIFEPAQLRGVSIASDARMSADALSGYAPRVKGIAAARATVRITQGGILLRELVVPPGPFEVDDLYAAGRGGDIEVDIEEHGRHRTFRVPFFPVPELLREGRTAYAVSAGSPGIVQASWRHGFPGDATAYAGGRLSRGEHSILVGGAIASLAGAFSVDVTRVRSGAMLWRARHGKLWAEGTLVSLGLALGRERDRDRDWARAWSGPVRRVDVLLQRDLGRQGSLGLNASHVAYGRGHGGALEQALSWARAWGLLTMDLTLRRSHRHGFAGSDRDVSGQLSLSMPLGLAAAAPRVHATILGGAHAGGGRLALHGHVGEEATTQYGVAVGRSRNQGGRLDASLSQRLAAGEFSATVDRSPGTQAASLSASGGLVIHRGGVTAAQRLGDAVALVQAGGARGAGVTGGTGVRIGRRGYAVVPYVTPYRWNAIDLDPAGTSLDVGFLSTHRRVAPTAGAVVLATFETELAKTLLVTGRLVDGRPLPFGAEVVDAADRSAGLVGQGGRIFLRSEHTSGQWTVRWSSDGVGQCVLRIQAGESTTTGDPGLTGVCE